MHLLVSLGRGRLFELELVLVRALAVLLAQLAVSCDGLGDLAFFSVVQRQLPFGYLTCLFVLLLVHLDELLQSILEELHLVLGIALQRLVVLAANDLQEALFLDLEQFGILQQQLLGFALLAVGWFLA